MIVVLYNSFDSFCDKIFLEFFVESSLEMFEFVVGKVKKCL